MPFEYTPYRSPFTGAIADLIGRQGDIAAQQALNEAKARTQAVSGVAQSLGNLAQYRADAPKRRLEQAMLAEKQQQLADAQDARMAARSLSAMMFDPNKGRFQPEGPSLDTPDGVLPEQEGFTTTTADGVELFDKAKVGQRMAELGHGAWMLEHGGKIDELNKSLLETDARDKQTIRDAVVMWAGLPKELQQPGASHIFKLISKRLSPEQAAVVQQQIDAGDTNGLMQMAQPYLPKPQAPRIGQFDPTKDVVDLNTGQIIRQGVPAPANVPPPSLKDMPNSYMVSGFSKPIPLTRDDKGQMYFGVTPLTPEQMSSVTPYQRPERPAAPSGQGATTTRMSDDAIEMLAVQLAAGLGNARSELTGLSEDARIRVRNAQADLNKKLERSPAAAVAIAAAAKGDAKSLESLKKQQANTSMAFDRLKPQGELVLANIGKLDRKDWTLVNKAIDYFNKNGKQNPDVSALVNAIATYTSEYAKIVEGSAGSVAATTVRAQKKAEEMLPVAGSPAAIKKLIEQMEQEAAFTVDAQAKAIRVSQDRIEQAFSAPPNTGQAQTPPPGARILKLNPATGKLEPQ